MAEADNYIEDFISMQGIYSRPPDQPSEAPPRGGGEAPGRPRRRVPKLDLDEEAVEFRSGVSPLAVFSLVLMSSLLAAAVNPSLLIFALPASTFVASLLAFAARERRKKSPRRLKL